MLRKYLFFSLLFLIPLFGCAPSQATQKEDPKLVEDQKAVEIHADTARALDNALVALAMPVPNQPPLLTNDSLEIPEDARIPIPEGGTGRQHSADTLIADIAIEADYELYQKFGSEAATRNYIIQLISDISAIYERDINVRLNPSFIRVATNPNDPWGSSTTSGTLGELRSYWNFYETGRKRAVVMLLSGRNLGGGVAYVGSLCQANYQPNNSYDYGVAAGLRGSYTTSPGSDTWDLVVVAHELGHSFNSQHAHCYQRSGSNDWYSKCYNQESGCYNGPAIASSGTIMSYCHVSSGMQAINPLSFTDGDPVMTNVMRSFAESVGVQSNAYGCLRVDDAAPPTPTPAPAGAISVDQVWTANTDGNAQSTFDAGDSLLYYGRVTNTTSSSQATNASWEISGPCGFTDGWSGSITANPGSSNWRLESTIPSDACGGTYSYRASVTYNGVTSSADTTFVVNSAATPTATPPPPTGAISVDLVWTADSGGNTQSTFDANNDILYYGRVTNTTSSSQTISARWEISGPCGFTDGWSGSLAADPGSKDWRLESTLPPDACAGTYNYQVSVTYGGVTSSAATTFVVNSAATVTVTPLPPTATATSTGTAVPPTATPVTPTSQPPTPTSPPPPTGARVETGHYTVRPNEQVDADITAIDLPSPGVGAATVDIKYDPTILNPVACEVDPDGRFNGSACNISFGDDIVRFSLTSSSGEAGSVNLATITFEAVGNDGETSPLEVMLTTWADTSGSDITSATVDGSVTLQDGVLGDVNCNGTRNVIDSLFVLQYTVGSRTGNDDCSLASNEIYMPLCDTNEDTNCNVIDALFIIQCEVGNSNVLCPSSRTVPATREQTGESAITVGSDAMASGTEVVIPVSANVPLNASFSAATVDIIYDHTVINAVTCNTNSDFVGSCHLTQNQAGDHVARFSVASATSRSGALDLVEITFNSSEGNTANSSDLIASVEMFVDDQGNPLPYTAENGRIDVSSVESSVSTSEYGIQKSSYNGAIAAGILMLLMGTAVMVQRRGR